MLPRRLRLITRAEQPLMPAVDSILDKHGWHDAVEEAAIEARETGSPLAVFFIDVNHFKDINDTLGHQAGDDVIAGIREMLQQELRLTENRPKEDRDLMWVHEAEQPSFYRGDEPEGLEIGHIGGDEFGILCQTDDIGARAIEERLRNAFNKYKASQDEELQALDISLAIGVSVLQPGMSGQELLRFADEDMYADKLRQLPPLSEEQKKFLLQLYEGLEQHKLRLRDLGKYVLMLSRETGVSPISPEGQPDKM